MRAGWLLEKPGWMESGLRPLLCAFIDAKHGLCEWGRGVFYCRGNQVM